MDWINERSEHYSLFYHPNSIAEMNLSQIIAWQEKCYQRLSNELGLILNRPIRMYLCNSPDEIAQITGCPPCNGMTFDYDLIYAVYNETTRCLGPHEDAHIFSYQIAIPNSFFLREGFAMYFDKSYHGRDNTEIAKDWFKSNKSFSITSLIDNRIFWQLPEEISYPLAGAFAQWIIQHYGMPVYLEIYRNEDYLNGCLAKFSNVIDSMFADTVSKCIRISWSSVSETE
ncbi:MAG: hypothetical protein E7329_02930 [Clostridiales bacterium]|nr:hypothetical protein [Clostridiales bacterium]